MKPSVIVLAKNEEQYIKKCIESVIHVAREVIVIDDKSSDKTAEIAKSAGARVVTHPLKDFSDQRAFGEREANSEWVLCIDADEYLSDELSAEIAALDERDYFAYYLRRRDVFWGTELKYGEVKTARDRGFIRLYKVGSGEWRGAVHEDFHTNVETRQLGGFIEHHSHQTVAEFLTAINYYSTVRAHELQREGARSTTYSVAVQPILKFIYTYFFKLGFRDGPAGFVYAFMMSFHSFLVRAKLYQYTELK